MLINIPTVKLGIIAVSRDCFIISLSERRRAAVVAACQAKGVDIYVRKVAPLGDPMELNVRGYELSVRKADAELIEVK